ncbi:MAG: DUF11 domain-containing protein [Bacteroidia bacterium]|nr:DUF11 domain-containing protein [Methylotenera sp.]
MKTSKFIKFAISVLLLNSLQLSAHAAGSVEFTNKAEVDVTVLSKDGKKETKRMPAKKVAPDGEVIYTTTFKNTIDKTISNIVITNPIPANMTYSGDSATGNNTEITYSVDGGKTYSPAEKLTVKGEDGKERPAQAGDFSHIRWVYKGDLATGKSSEVGFKAKVK